MRMLDLFSGIGGFALAAEWRWGDELEIAGFCEIEKYAQKVLKKNFPGVPIYEDITKLKGDQFENIDLITGGFPCQDISIAGKGKGLIDEETGERTRSGLWSEMHRIISEVRPRYAIIENVPMLIHRGFERVLCDLTSSGFDCEWQIIGADEVGAWHRRKRIWIVAYPNEAKETHQDSIGGRQLDRKSQEERIQDGQFGESGSRGGKRVHGERENVSNTNNTRDRASTSRIDKNGKKKNKRRKRLAQPESSRHSKNVSNTNDNGRNKSRCEKTCRKNNTRKNNKSLRSANTNNTQPQNSNDGARKKPRVGTSVIRRRNDQKNKTSRTKEICQLSEKTNQSKRTIKKDRNKKNNSRTLVQIRPNGIQPSINKRLGENQTSSKKNKIRQGDDLLRNNRMGRRKRNVPNTSHSNDTPCKSEERSEKFKFRRSSSREDVSNSNIGDAQTGCERSGGVRKESSGERASSDITSSRKVITNTDSKRLQRLVERSQESRGSDQQIRLRSRTRQGGWWNFEPELGRVANGIPNRIHRLRGLGNAIVPQVAYEIMKRIK